MLNNNLHNILDYLNKVIDVSDKKLINVLLKYRNSKIFRVYPKKEFIYSVINRRLKVISIFHFNPKIGNHFYTYGLNIKIKNIIEDTNFAVIYIDDFGITIFDKKDCKELFDYTEDDPITKSLEKKILKSIGEIDLTKN